MKLKLEKRNINTQIGESNRTIQGVIPYESKSQRMYLGYTTDAEYEVLERTAFNKTLGDKRRVYMNYNHDDNCILANTKSGTLKLENRDDGLHFTAELPDTDIGNRAYQTIKRGDCDTLSFEFYVRDYEIRDNISYVKSCQLEAISCCVINPAYESTNVHSLRCVLSQRNIDVDELTDAIENNKVNESVEKLANALNKLIESNKSAEQPKPEDPVTESEAAETEQPKDTPVQNTPDEVKNPEPKVEDTAEYKEKLEQLKELENELAAELETI